MIRGVLVMNSHNYDPNPQSADADSSSAAGSTPRAAAAVGGSGGGGHVLHQHNHILRHPHPLPPARWHPDDPSAPLVRLMCSYGGLILPRPHDNQLRYVGGETRIVAVPRSASFCAVLSRLSKLLPPAAGCQAPCLKYQLPHEDLDALVSLTSDEDVESMFDEYERLAPAGGRAPRLRLFLFPPPSAAFGSVVDAQCPTGDQWFVDALNGGGAGTASAPPSLERGRSEASSIISEVPDYLFGLDANSDEPLTKPRAQPVSSEPGSPFSASSQPSVPLIPDLPPVKTKPSGEETRRGPVEQVAQGLMPNPVPVPVFCMPAPVHGGSLSLQQVPTPVQYVHSLGPTSGGQLPLWFPQPFPVGVVAKPVQGGPAVYVGGPPFGAGAALGSGYEHEVAASVVIPAYQATGVPVAGGAEAAVADSETKRVARPAY